MKTNATMLYGHIETFEHRVDHLLRAARAAGRDAAGFQAFIPLAFHPDGNGMKNLPGPTGVDDLRTIAVSRLMLDNVEHIKAYWVSSTPKVAQIALRFGADDIDGTIVHETIYHAAGSTARRGAHARRCSCASSARRASRPIERDTYYGVVEELRAAALPEAR